MHPLDAPWTTRTSDTANPMSATRPVGKAGRPKGPPQHRRTRKEASDERPHILRRSEPAKGTAGTATCVSAYVALDPETFEQVRGLAVGAGTSFGAQVRTLVEAGLAVDGESLPAEASPPVVAAVRQSVPAVGATRRKDSLLFCYVRFTHVAFDAVRGRALAQGTSVAEQVRQLVEWGLEP